MIIRETSTGRRRGKSTRSQEGDCVEVAVDEQGRIALVDGHLELFDSKLDDDTPPLIVAARDFVALLNHKR